MASSKEACFRKAIDKINEAREATGKGKLPIEHEQGWIRDLNGSWKPAAWYQELWYSIRKTLRIQDGVQDPRTPGAPNPIQFRKPDITLTRPDGSKVVLDNKFTGADGKPDPWRDQPGMSGSKQKGDYEDINKKQGNDVGEPKLDKDSCECNKRKLETEKVEVRVYVPQPGTQLYFMPLPAPGGIPLPAPAPAPLPMPGLIPVFP